MTERGRGPRAGTSARGRGSYIEPGKRPSGSAQAPTRDVRAPILDLAKYVDKQVRVKFAGGREVLGILKGYDQLLNLVLDQVEEALRDPETLEPIDPPVTRSLGLVILRGTALIVINPVDGMEEIANPFAQD